MQRKWKSRIETQAATGIFRPRKIGEYEALDLIGEGGMASVYEALDRDGHVCALKVPHSHLLRDEEVRNRFFREV
ncbi:MAG: hypothetical protein HYU64_16295, partial [Armatimonadetes bacterium]|nr:hypothetical protein [Armatimonadota bacterium]